MSIQRVVTGESSASKPPRANQVESKLVFKHLRGSSSFSSLVKKILGDSVFDKICDKRGITSEVLFRDEKPLGVIAYKDDLKGNSKGFKAVFQLKAFAVIESSEKKCEEVLLSRVIKVAKKLIAQEITFDVFNNSTLYDFFTRKGFRTLNNKGDAQSSRLVHFSMSSQKNDHKQTVSIDKKDLKRASLEEQKNVPEKQDPSLKKRKTDEVESNPKAMRSEEKRLPLSSVTTHNLPMKGTIYFDYIMNGKKKFEGRVCGGACNSMRVGDHLKLFDNKARWGIICEITSKDVYKSFEEMLKAKGVLSMLPQLEDKSKILTQENFVREGVKIYEAFPGSNRVKQYGAVAIGVKFLEKIYN